MTGRSSAPQGDDLALSDDAFLGGSLNILQPLESYRAGLDAVLLAAAAASEAEAGAEGGARVLDCGAGVGVVGLAIARHVAKARVTLVEIDGRLARLAEENARRNGLAERICVIEADVGGGGAVLNAPDRPSGLVPGSFDLVVANPPFGATGAGTAPRCGLRQRAHQMSGDALQRWIAFMATAARHGGRLTLIHRADALDQVLGALGGRFGGVRVRPVHPRPDAAASRVIVAASKGSRAPLTLLPGLVLHGDGHAFRPDVEAILRRGALLAL